MHAPYREVICAFCGKGFKTQLAARMHENQHHGQNRQGEMGKGEGSPADKGSRNNDYQCPVCRRDFDTKAQAQRHMLRIHSGAARSFICEQCGKGFKVKSDLQHHMKTHGEKSLPCNLCELKFRTLNSLKHHRMTHTGERPNVCPYCQHGFIQIGACKSHVLKVHGVEVPKGISMKKFTEGLSSKPKLDPS